MNWCSPSQRSGTAYQSPETCSDEEQPEVEFAPSITTLQSDLRREFEKKRFEPVVVIVGISNRKQDDDDDDDDDDDNEARER